MKSTEVGKKIHIEINKDELNIIVDCLIDSILKDLDEPFPKINEKLNIKKEMAYHLIPIRDNLI